MGDNRIRERLVESPTISDLQKAWCGVHSLVQSGNQKEAQAINKVIRAFMQVRMLTGAEEYPNNEGEESHVKD